MMDLLRVDQEKCINCGACAAVCPNEVIAVDQGGPKESGIGTCISCGHCVAVCPVEAIDNVRTPLANQVSIEKPKMLDTKVASQFLRSRRSVRCYKEQQVPQTEILKLLDIARFAPTGGNTQGLSYMVISDKEKMKKVIEATVTWMEEETRKGSPWGRYFAGVIRKYRETGKDVILRGAPHLLMALSAKEFGRGQENAHFSLAYAELLAPTLEIGTCWAGFFQACAFSGYTPLLEILDIPADKVLAGALMVGYPKYTYRRLVDRNPLQVIWE